MDIVEITAREAAEALARVPELARPVTAAAIDARIGGRPALLLGARRDGALVGVKLGYALDAGTFYSWLGGVAPAARGRGVARALLGAQERWARDHGYAEVRVRSRNRFVGMVRLLFGAGYAVVGFEAKGPVAEHRLHFVKRLSAER